jgi:glycosyltransferase involved in cell wall biosynthesis
MRTGMLLAWLLSRPHRFTLIGHVHNVHDRESVMMGLADCVIAVSQSTALTMVRRGINHNKIRVVLNRTLGSQRYPDFDELTPATLPRPSIVTVCGMTRRKGIAELLSAFEVVGEEFANAHLYLVGDGPERKHFERQARHSRWFNRIHFEGFQALPQAYMLSADVFVLASRRESFGLVLIEARQAGCAIIATNVDGVAEAMDDGLAGVLIPSRNVHALATAMCHLLSNEKERSAWRSRARRGTEAFRIQVMASEVQYIYDELIGVGNLHSAFNIAVLK